MSDIGPVEQMIERLICYCDENPCRAEALARAHDAEDAARDASIAEKRGLIRDLTTALENRNRDLTVRDAALRQAGEELRKHGKHGDGLTRGCRRLAYGLAQTNDNECDCGLYAAIAVIEALEVTA